MKKLMALAVVLMSTSLFAVDVDAGNNMAQEPAPNKIREPNYRTSDYNRRHQSDTSYGSEMNDDTISTGQSSTRRRNSMDTPSSSTRASERCIDRSGYSYSKNDSGYAACVNQTSREMRPR